MSELPVQTRASSGVTSWHVVGTSHARLSAHAWTLVAFGAALLLFAMTAAPDLTWAHNGYDGGELITASYTLGVPHPPGYPTYVLLGNLFGALPIGTIAYRYHIFSGVAVAVAVALLARTLMSASDQRLSPSTASAVAVGVALLPPIWSQATIAEVYGLNLALVAAFVFALLVLKRPLVTGIILGLVLTTHVTSILLIPAALALTPRANWPRMAGGMAVGLLPLLLLPSLATSGSPVVWGDPTTLSGLWWLVSGQLYSANLGLPTLTSLFASPALPGSVGIVTFVTVLVVTQPQTTKSFKRDRKASTVFALTAVAYALFALLYRVSDAGVFLLPAYLLLALAAAQLWNRAGHWLWLLPVFLLIAGWNQHNLRNEMTVRPQAEFVLSSAPENAILLTPGDRTIFTLWYFHHVEQQRPDVILVDENLFAFDWYRTRLGSANDSLMALKDDDLALFTTTNGATHPVCRTKLVGSDGQPVATISCEESARNEH